MKITSLNIPADRSLLGLQRIQLSNLSSLVILAGENGSGKTRLLSAIKDTLDTRPIFSEVTNNRKIADYHNNSIAEIRVAIRNAKEFPEENEKKIKTLEKRIDNLKEKVRNLNFLDQWDEITFDTPHSEKVTTVNCIPRRTDLKSYRTLTQEEQDSLIARSSSLGTDTVQDYCLTYLKRVQDLWHNATHPSTSMAKKDREIAIRAYGELTGLVSKFLSSDLLRNADGHPVLFQKPLHENHLSNGQKILLQICVQIHSQEKKLKDLILFLDEPENHLHPSAAISVIKTIRSSAPTCQLWVATHSLPILSYFTEATLLFATDGKVSYAGSEPEQVLKTLLGDEERILKLQDFTNLPATLALNRYAAECLLPPKVVGGSQEDDQAKQIQKFLSENSPKNRKIRILDCGAGKGRLLSNLIQLEENVTERIDYFAFDPFPDDSDICKALIKTHYSCKKKRYFASYKDLTADGKVGQFDLIVMCNVLHEIDPSRWISMFKAGGDISKLLNNNGHLLVVEDELIPVGEMAHQNGFIVYDTTEFRELFSVTDGDGEFVRDEKRNGRLMAHLIKKEWLIRITTETIKSSLKARKICAINEIEKIRKNDVPNFRAGRAHGFWVQQLANATLALQQYQ
jgi:predicted ATPase/SAM-dependent methyltransferase